MVVLLAVLGGGASAASTGAISGVVKDADGHLITSADICVTAWGFDPNDNMIGQFTATSAADGSYTVTGLPTGSYYLEFDDCESSSRNDVPASYPDFPGEPAKVTDGQTTSGIDVQLAAATTISGHVYAGAGTATPLAGICAETMGQTAKTTASGAYTIKHLGPDQDYVVRFRDCNDPAVYLQQYYDGASDYDTATAVHPTIAGPATGIDAHLEPGASISGTVQDADGKAITTKDICVWADGDMTGGSATSDASGHYTVGGLPADSYFLYFSDCPESARNDVSTTYSGGKVAVADKEAKTGIDQKLAAGTSISGHVYGGAGTATPLSGACVYASDQGGGGSGYADTGSDGAYTIKHIKSGGAFVVDFSACSNSAYTDQYYDGVSSWADATPVSPTTASPATGIDAHLAKGATISGTVKDADGKTITTADICVTAYDAAHGRSRGARSDAQGGYSLIGLPAGTYALTFSDCYDSARNDMPTNHATVTVQAGEQVGGIDQKLDPATTISGHAYGTSDTSAPLSGICVNGQSVAGSDVPLQARTAADGSYTLLHATPGHGYKVRFSDCTVSTWASQYYDGVTSYGDATTLTPTLADPATGVDAHMVKQASISGTVMDADGNPITSGDICISAEGDGGGYGYGVSGAGGKYTVTGLVADTYMLTFSDCSSSTRNDVATDGDAPVTVGAGEAKTGVDQKLRAGTSISGHVYAGAGTGSPLPGICVSASDAAGGGMGGSMGSVQSASDGKYVLKHLDPAGAGFKVYFSACYGSAAYAPQYYDNADTFDAAATLTPTVANPSTGIDAHMSSGASISGTVMDADGNAITSKDVCMWASPTVGGGGKSGVSDETGAYTLTGLTAGSYYVYFNDCASSTRNDVPVYYGGVRDQSKSTIVVLSTSGAKTGVDVKLPPGTSVSGTVYEGDGNGTPLANVCVGINSVYDPNASYASGYDQTGADGAYVIRHLPPMDQGYTVRFNDCSMPQTHVAQYYGGDFSSGSTIKPTVAAPSAGIDGHLALGGSISGTITDDQGAPITSQDICVDASRKTDNADFRWYSAYATSKSDGTYVVGGLPTGTYTLTVQDCGSSGPNARNDLSQTLDDIAVTQPNATGGHDASLKPATSIAGHVYGGAGTATPLRSICVYAYDGANPFGASSYASTAQDGSYRLLHLAPGTGYKVEFSPCYSNVQYSPQYYDGVSSFDAASVLTPTLASPSTGIDAHLTDDAPLARITGGPANNAATNETTATFTFDADAAGASFECALDGGALQPCTSPYATGQLASGGHSFAVRASFNGKTQNVPTTVSWTVDTSSTTDTSQGQVASHGTFDTDPGTDPSASTPVTAQVTLPSGGQVTVTKEPATTPSGNGYTVFGQQLDIAAQQPDGTGTVTGTKDDPIRLTFSIDGSAVPDGTDLTKVTVLRNGTAAADCATPGAGKADPDPCVDARTPIAGGGITLTILTTHCSVWNFGVSDGTPPPAKPSNTAAPSVSGNTTLGSVLTADHGTWSGDAPIAYAYQWQRDGADIGGETASTHTIVAADQGHTLRVVVTATNVAGSASANSAGKAIPAPPKNTVAPSVSGAATLGAVLTAAKGTWTGDAPIAYAYQWQRDGADLAGETASTHTIVAADQGHTLRVVVTATNVAGSVSANSAGKAIPAPPANTAAPSVSGAAAVGAVLTAAKGTWTGDAPIAYAYQWQRDGADLAGETASTHTIVAADQGHTLRVVVTATNVAGSASAASDGKAIPAAPADNGNSNNGNAGGGGGGGGGAPATTDGGGGSTSGQSTGGGNPGPAPAPAVTIGALAKMKLSKLLAKGLSVPLTCAGTCTVTVTLEVAAKDAKKLHLAKKATKVVVIAQVKASFGTGAKVLQLKLSSSARRALKKARGLKATLRVTVDGGLPLARTMTWKR